ncbi:hypothetical protein MKEN_01375200 [Mycena kentingensis (nom. inval.)]|nr:hypothetical protein MKEN_01375200 [Mycena kentingensis (nom. inval.)]
MSDYVVGHRGFDVWLTGENHTALKLGQSSLNAEGNRVRIQVSLERETQYAVEWCCISEPVNAVCTVLLSDGTTGGKPRKVADEWMSTEDEETQKGTTVGRMNLPYDRDAFLSTPSAAEAGSVALEIRRLKEPPVETQSIIDSHTGVADWFLEADYLDSDDPNLIDPRTHRAMPAFVTFLFEFKPADRPKKVSPRKPRLALTNQIPVVVPRAASEAHDHQSRTEQIEQIQAKTARKRALLDAIDRENQKKAKQIEDLEEKAMARAMDAVDQSLAEKKKESAELDARLQRIRELA